MKVFLVLTVIWGLATAASFPFPESRIVGGEEALIGMFPYQAGLLLTRNDSSNAWCGGCLISKDWVLTAAHCTYWMESIVVYLGAVNRTKPLQAIESTEFYVHEEYSPDAVFNDISLIKLSVSAVLSENVEPAVLPRRFGTISNYYGDTAIASGWGRTTDNTTSVSEELNYIFNAVSPNTVCLQVYYLVKGSQLCMNTVNKGSYKSPCSGDSGGPLVLNDYQRTLIGLTSYGHKSGCEKGYPAVFTRVTSYLEWIKNISGVYNN